MTASPPRELTSQQKQQLVQQFGGDGNLGGLLVDFAASLHKVRVACGNDRFVPLMVRRLAG
jgi:hypothetical protein